jgi:hypothetical protein
MNDTEKIKAIKKYLKRLSNKLLECQENDREYTTLQGNGCNAFEAGLLFDEIEEEVNKIVNGE